MPKITSKQKAVLEAILEFTKEHKYPPTVRELCDMLNLKSSSTVHGHLSRLKLRGLISWEPSLPRTVHIKKEVMKDVI